VNSTPAAEVDVSADLVRRLLADQHLTSRGGAGGRVGDALRARARGWALNFAIVFLAHSEDNPVLLDVGRRTLRAVLEDQRGPAG